MGGVLICNKDETMFIHEIRGACFVTWVSFENKDEACLFSKDKAKEWCELIKYMTKIETKIYC